MLWEGEGGCCSFRCPLFFFYLTKCNKQLARISTDPFKPFCQQVVTLTTTTNYIRRECFVFHMFRVSVSTFQVGQALFFALNIYLSLRDNWDYLSLATIKISANKKSWPDNSSHGSVNCTCTNDQIWACYQSTKN